MAEFVPYTRRETYQLHNIPAPHLRNIDRRSAKRNMSYAEVVARVLAYRYQIPLAPSIRKRPRTSLVSTPAAWPHTSLSVRLPPEVMDAVRAEADETGITIRSVMLNALSDAFRLKRPPATHVEPGSRPGRRKEHK